MAYQLTPDELKVDTQYSIEFHAEDFIKYNKTYNYIRNFCCYIGTVYEFKNINNGKILFLDFNPITLNLDDVKIKGYFTYTCSFISCDITELTTKYILK